MAESDKNSNNNMFVNKELQESINKAMPWLDAWNDFKASVEQDINTFEDLLNTKKIPICVWVEIDEEMRLGWSKDKKSGYMKLLFQKSNNTQPVLVQNLDLETKVLIFPYLSELSFSICSKIKLAHVRNIGLSAYADAVLDHPNNMKKDADSPQRFFKYA